MSKFGFDSEDKIDLPIPQKNKTKASTATIQKVAKAGQNLGFVSRETSPTKSVRRRGRRQTQTQDKILVTGPKQIIDAFKEYCDREESPSYCAGLGELLSKNGLLPSKPR